jgi:lipid A 4'-phosphatase
LYHGQRRTTAKEGCEEAMQTKASGDSGDRTYLVALRLLAGSILVGGIAAVFFVKYPRIDVVTAQYFHTTGRHFIGTNTLGFEIIRQMFNAFFYTVCVVTVLGVYLSHSRWMWSGLDARKWMFLAVCILAGPLAVTNLGFKDHWGRARPRDVVEFGGRHTYTAALLPAHECERNCSFVSGEASSIFSVGFAAMILFPVQAPFIMVTGILLGCLAGLVRMIQGAHFLSDVVFAGVFMGITVAIVHLTMELLLSRRMVRTAAKTAAKNDFSSVN